MACSHVDVQQVQLLDARHAGWQQARTWMAALVRFELLSV